MSKSEIFPVAEFPCCQEERHCACGPEERVLRSYISGRATEPMEGAQRGWCIKQAVQFGEGHYQESELYGLTDKELAESVLRAWQMYVRSNTGFDL